MSGDWQKLSTGGPELGPGTRGLGGTGPCSSEVLSLGGLLPPQVRGLGLLPRVRTSSGDHGGQVAHKELGQA